MDVVAENEDLVMYKGSGILLYAFVSPVGGATVVPSTYSADSIQQHQIFNGTLHRG